MIRYQLVSAEHLSFGITERSYVLDVGQIRGGAIVPIPDAMRRAGGQRRTYKETKRCKDINLGLMLAEAKAISSDPGIILAMRRANWIRQELYEWVRSYEERGGEVGKALFRRDWTFFRTWVPLQIRLAIEQILWNSFGEYRDLVSGFDPIGKKRGTSGTSAGSRAPTWNLGGPSGSDQASAVDQVAQTNYDVVRLLRLGHQAKP